MSKRADVWIATMALVGGRPRLMQVGVAVVSRSVGAASATDAMGENSTMDWIFDCIRSR